jgi:hypothetical protein
MGGQKLKMYGIYINTCKYTRRFTVAGLADIFVVDLKSSFRSEPLHNIFTYHKTGSGGAEELAAAFIDDLLPAIQILQTGDIITESVYAYSLGDLTDLAEVVVGTAGGGGDADMLPIFNALNFTLKPTSRAVRPGSKRFAGIPESAQADGFITLGGYITGIEGLRTALDSGLDGGTGETFEIVVVKRVKYEVPDSDPVRFAYRFPETDEELVYSTVRTVLSNLKISHQVSRGN